MSSWQVEEATVRFSGLLERAICDGPQLILRRGETVTLRVAASQLEARQQRPKHNLKDVMLDPAGPKLDRLVLPERGRKARR